MLAKEPYEQLHRQHRDIRKIHQIRTYKIRHMEKRYNYGLKNSPAHI